MGEMENFYSALFGVFFLQISSIDNASTALRQAVILLKIILQFQNENYFIPFCISISNQNEGKTLNEFDSSLYLNLRVLKLESQIAICGNCGH